MSKKVQCTKHGNTVDAYLCIHLAGAEKGSGFIEADCKPGESPVAWCSFCEYLRETDAASWEDAIVDLLSLVCRNCYNLAKASQNRQPDERTDERLDH